MAILAFNFLYVYTFEGGSENVCVFVHLWKRWHFWMTLYPIKDVMYHTG